MWSGDEINEIDDKGEASAQGFPISWCSHLELINLMKKLGYPADDDGVCVGVAYLATQAMLLGQADRFNERLRLISEIINSEKKLPDHLSEKEFSEVIAALAETLSIEDAQKPPDILAGIPAFFEGILLHSQLGEYPYLFASNDQVMTQNIMKTIPFILPEILKQQGGISEVDVFCGAYTIRELISTLEILRQMMRFQIPVTLILDNYDMSHTIAVGNNPAADEWLFIDANQLPIHHITSEEQLAEKIMKAFTCSEFMHDTIVFSTSIYTIKASDDQVKQQIERCKQTVIWQQIHRVSLEKVRLMDSLNASWLYAAAKAGEIGVVSELLEHGIDASVLTWPVTNEPAPTPSSALLAAVFQHHRAIVWLLLKAKANPNLNLLYPSAPAPLRVAASYGELAIVFALILYGAEINSANKYGNTALSLAVRGGHLEVINYLLVKGACPNIASFEGVTPLMIAAQRGDRAAVNALLKYDANPYLSDCHGATALFFAQRHGDVEVIRCLFKLGLEPNASSHPASAPPQVTRGFFASTEASRAKERNKYEPSRITPWK